MQQNIVGQTVLGVDAFICTWLNVWTVSNFAQQLPTTHNNMQQGVQTDATCNIQQCWELLANEGASIYTGIYCLFSEAQQLRKKNMTKKEDIYVWEATSFLGWMSFLTRFNILHFRCPDRKIGL